MMLSVVGTAEGLSTALETFDALDGVCFPPLPVITPLLCYAYLARLWEALVTITSTLANAHPLQQGSLLFLTYLI
jgi:hypothetical protein